MNYAILLRGVNVGGKNKLPMAELRQALSDTGLESVQSYIQSGNLLCQSSEPADTIAKLCREVLRDQFDIQTPVFVLSQNTLSEARDNNPYRGKENLDKALQMTFLSEKASDANLAKLHELKADSELFSLSDSCFYLYAPEGIGRSKLAAASERYLNVTTTTRNWRTVNKILQLMP